MPRARVRGGGLRFPQRSVRFSAFGRRRHEGELIPGVGRSAIRQSEDVRVRFGSRKVAQGKWVDVKFPRECISKHAQRFYPPGFCSEFQLEEEGRAFDRSCRGAVHRSILVWAQLLCFRHRLVVTHMYMALKFCSSHSPYIRTPFFTIFLAVMSLLAFGILSCPSLKG